MNKPCTVIISGRPPGENLVDIEVPSGANSLDVLQAVGLDRNWTLSREGSNQVFAHEEDVFAAIEPGCKLRAAPLAEVGWLRWMRRIFGRKNGIVVTGDQRTAPRPRSNHVVKSMQAKAVIAPMPSQQAQRSVVGRPATPGQVPSSGRIQVERDRRSVLDSRGWRRKGNWLLGAYRLGRRGAFAGAVDVSNRKRPRFFIVGPPVSVLEGSHGACFHRRGGDRFEIHFGIFSPEVDAGILAIEKLLFASIAGANGKGKGR